MALRAPRFAANARLQKAANNNPALAIGETSEGVRALQQAFIDLGYPMPKSTKFGWGPPDGIFGSETNAVTKQFQKQWMLTVDGVAGKQTLTKLDDLFAQNDTHYADPLRERAKLAAEMTGPEASRPFAATTARKGGA